MYNLYNSSILGDPHVLTLNGGTFKIDKEGFIRMFDNNDENNRIVINGEVRKGPGRWSKNTYYSRMFFYENGNYLLVDLGFRGIPVTIIENNYFNYTENKLNFNINGKIHCYECLKYFKISEIDLVNEHRIETNHKILDPIRNQLNLKLGKNNEISIKLENINEFNLQPDRLFFKVNNANELKKKSSGVLVHRNYAITSSIENIKDISPIKKPTEEEIKHIEKIAPYEISPILKNEEWK